MVGLIVRKIKIKTINPENCLPPERPPTLSLQRSGNPNAVIIMGLCKAYRALGNVGWIQVGSLAGFCFSEGTDEWEWASRVIRAKFITLKNKIEDLVRRNFIGPELLEYIPVRDSRNGQQFWYPGWFLNVIVEAWWILDGPTRMFRSCLYKIIKERDWPSSNAAKIFDPNKLLRQWTRLVKKGDYLAVLKDLKKQNFHSSPLAHDILSLSKEDVIRLLALFNIPFIVKSHKAQPGFMGIGATNSIDLSSRRAILNRLVTTLVFRIENLEDHGQPLSTRRASYDEYYGKNLPLDKNNPKDSNRYKEPDPHPASKIYLFPKSRRLILLTLIAILAISGVGKAKIEKLLLFVDLRKETKAKEAPDEHQYLQVDNDPKSLLAIGFQAIKAKNPELAKEYIHKALSTRKLSEFQTAKCYFLLGKVYHQESLFDLASNHFDSAYCLYSQVPNTSISQSFALAEEARSQIFLGSLDRASELLGKAWSKAASHDSRQLCYAIQARLDLSNNDLENLYVTCSNRLSETKPEDRSYQKALSWKAFAAGLNNEVDTAFKLIIKAKKLREGLEFEALHRYGDINDIILGKALGLDTSDLVNELGTYLRACPDADLEMLLHYSITWQPLCSKH